MIELKPPPKDKRKEEVEINFKLEWEKGALLALNEITPFVRTMVVEMAEDIVQKEGSSRMTHERFLDLMREYAPKEVMERFVIEEELV